MSKTHLQPDLRFIYELIRRVERAQLKTSLREANGLLDKKGNLNADSVNFNAIAEFVKVTVFALTLHNGAPTSTEEIAMKEPAPSCSRLHIGGTQARQGWLLMNIQALPGVDIVGDIRGLEIFPDAAFQEIYCSHVLEHVPHSEITEVLRQIFRILSPSGTFYVAVPDFEDLCHLMLCPAFGVREKLEVMKIIFGGQLDEHDFHKVGLSQPILCHYLENVGFKEIARVDDFGLFDDVSKPHPEYRNISLNLVARKGPLPE